MESAMSTLEIRGLKVTVDTEQGVKEILKGVDLTIKSGETHAIMGPNGSGKSTLAYSIAGHPKYTITGGTVTLDGADVLEMSVDERAKAGLFLAMQYPVWARASAASRAACSPPCRALSPPRASPWWSR